MSDKALPTPVDWDQLYPGRFLKAGDFLGKTPTLTIARVELDELEGNKGKKITGILHFERTDKQLTLNKTNGLCLKAMLGRNVQEWVGKRITLCTQEWTDPETKEAKHVIRIHGSPDIAADTDVLIQLPRKRPFKMTMRRVETKQPQQQESN